MSEYDNRVTEINDKIITYKQYMDFFNRYEKIDINLPNTDNSLKEIKALKKQGYKIKYKTYNFVDMAREYRIIGKGIRLKENMSYCEYDKDLIEYCLKGYSVFFHDP